MRSAYVILAMLLFSSPIFAANITTVVNSASSTAYVNTRANVTVLNITIFANITPVTILGVNITFAGNSTPQNVSIIRVLNSTNAGLLGQNTTWTNNNTVNFTFVNFTSSGNLNLPAHQNQSLLIVFEIHENATPTFKVAANVTSSSSISANVTVTNTTALPANSSLVQIQNVHANASITPRFVDTSVINQSFFYVIRPTGTDGINKTVLNIPVGYTLVSLDSVEHDGTNNTAGITNLTSPNQINVTLSTPTTSTIILRFKLNTNSSDKLNLAFNSTLENGNLTNVATDVFGTNTTVYTQQIVNITSVTPIKNAAYLNGTDYWEFLFSLNFTVNVSGRLQFNMSSWNSSSSIINLNSSGTHYATIRSNSNFSSQSTINITNEHNMSSGIAFNTSSISNSSIYLRMVIPSSVTTVSSSWWAVYTIIFRSDP